ncbi:serine/threonine protein kinase [Pedobacter sp. UYP24]
MQTLKQLQDGELSGAITLKLSEGLSTFPEEIFNLAESLEVLDLSGNKLSSLPPNFGKLKKLRIFFCSDNLFKVMPEVLADCPDLDIVGFKANFIETIPAKALNKNLRWLILTNNQISALPDTIGSCKRMQKLMLAGNKLEELPESLSNCTNLSLLRISANLLQEFPKWLLTMPKLSWLAFSGNPFSHKPQIQSIPFVDWKNLEIGKKLGEGASGVIYQARLNTKHLSKAIAIKVFKGSVTSDGLPQDEMDTCITAGNHPGLVQLIGQIASHPEDKKGLVMELIQPRFYNLGGPPSMESCTRDVFRSGARLSVSQVLKIAATIASVAAQLHSKGIMHGDLYAHNTLTDHEGNTLFGDFGAASFYDSNNMGLTAHLERIEVSAFGWLLDDLINLCEEQECIVINELKQLRDHCTSEKVSARPVFSAITANLLTLQ